MTSNRKIGLSKTIALIIAFSALLDGLFGVVYLREGMYQSAQKPSFGGVALGLLVAGGIFSFAKYFEQKTAKKIVYSVSLLTFIQTVSSATQFFSHYPQISILFHLLEFGCDLLIIYTCFVHFRKV